MSNSTPKGASVKTVSAHKQTRLLIASVVVIAAVAIALLTYQPKESTGPKCGLYRNDKTITIGSERIESEVVQTAADRNRGLAGRPCIESNQGMLFVFDKPGKYSFWMKGMHFPIDIVWISTDHKVVALERNVSPSTYPDSFVSEKPAQYVLELQANRSKALNIGLGMHVNF